MYAIFWKPKAVRQLEKIKDKQVKVDIMENVDKLEDFQKGVGNNIKALKNHPYDFRLKVGRYRVLFSVNRSIQIIDIEEVKKRNERTY